MKLKVTRLYLTWNMNGKFTVHSSDSNNMGKFSVSFSKSFSKGQALGKSSNCEDDFVCIIWPPERKKFFS